MATSSPLLPILTLSISNEADVVLVRQRARIVSELLGLPAVDQTRVATAVSEIARNALTHGGGGSARFAAGGKPPALHVTIQNRGPGVLRPRERRGAGAAGPSGGGMGLELSRRLMDGFDITDPEEGTSIHMSKDLPDSVAEIGPSDVSAVVEELMARPPESLLEELHQQHQELLAVLEDLNRQQESLRAANHELEETNRGVMALYTEVARELDDTNRGVVALYAQLDDQARELRRVNALKDRFLSHLSHEFRTPLNSTLAISRLLANRVDGPLTDEQAVQVEFIRKGAEDLLDMVSDLLDLAKIEAGRMELRPEELAVDELVGALRGMFRPLAAESNLELDLADPDPSMPPMWTDRGKLSQVLRNLLANAIQYTPQGKVWMTVEQSGDRALFTVGDTGVGIAPEDMERIFQDFGQATAPRRANVRGTGLGLPIARELSRMLGGELMASSRPGEGSMFRVLVPLRLEEPGTAEPAREPEVPSASEPPIGREERDVGSEVPGGEAGDRLARTRARELRRSGSSREPVALVIDDDAASRYVVEHTLGPAGCRVIHAETAAQGREAARAHEPDVIFLDLGLPDASGFDLLRELETDPDLAHCPVVIYTCRELDPRQARSLSGFALIHKSDRALLGSLAGIGDALVGMQGASEDDDEDGAS